MKDKGQTKQPVHSKDNKAKQTGVNKLVLKKLNVKQDKNKTTASSKDTVKGKSKKNTSLRLDKATLKALKIKAIENDTSVQKLIESLIKDYLASP